MKKNGKEFCIIFYERELHRVQNYVIKLFSPNMSNWTLFARTASYARAWRLLSDFIGETGIRIFPLDVVTLGLFTVRLRRLNYSVSSIRTFASAISYYHNLYGYSDPGSSFFISKTFLGLNKLYPSSDSREPIDIHLLFKIVERLQKNQC